MICRMETDSKEKNHKSETRLKVSDLRVGAIYSHKYFPDDLFLLLQTEIEKEYLKAIFLDFRETKRLPMLFRIGYDTDLFFVASGVKQGEE